MTSSKLLVIGGLVLNQEPLKELKQLNSDLIFIDINAYPMPFDLDSVTRLIKKQILSLYTTPIILVGYSTGGLICIKLAQEIPELIHKLIFINSTPCFLANNEWLGIKHENFDQLHKKLNYLTLEKFKNHFTNLAVYPKTHRLEESIKFQSEHANKDSLLNWFSIILSADLRGELALIEHPILWLYAEHDVLIPNTNNLLSNSIITKYTMHHSSHAFLCTTQLISKIKEFCYAK